MKKLLAFSFAFVFAISAYSQTDGDALINIIGSQVKASNTASFLTSNNVKYTADGIYSSTSSGIDIRTSHDSIVSMTLYHDNPIYGKYTHQLPKGIQFDMTSAEIVKKLGKPTVEYINSGYCEYHFPGYVLTCWFEKGVLRRLTLSSQ
jgi:hypothetical protein